VESLLLILEFIAGIILIFAFGTLIGHILELDKYLNNTVGKKTLKHG
jgi:uncharacterized membrane protein YqgA involved in biofilm formation